MQSAGKSGHDDNIDDFLGYIEIPVKVHSEILDFWWGYAMS